MLDFYIERYPRRPLEEMRRGRRQGYAASWRYSVTSLVDRVQGEQWGKVVVTCLFSLFRVLAEPRNTLCFEVEQHLSGSRVVIVDVRPFE